MTGKHLYKVLMADDDNDDCYLAKDAFFDTGVKVDFTCIEDGEKLLDFLCQRSQREKKELPDLILLDLNMPRKDGRQTLLEIKSKPILQEIPIVIFSTSSEEKDIRFTLKAGADLFITKPTTYDEWVTTMKSLADKWLI